MSRRNLKKNLSNSETDAPPPKMAALQVPNAEPISQDDFQRKMLTMCIDVAEIKNDLRNFKQEIVTKINDIDNTMMEITEKVKELNEKVDDGIGELTEKMDVIEIEFGERLEALEQFAESMKDKDMQDTDDKRNVSSAVPHRIKSPSATRSAKSKGKGKLQTAQRRRRQT